MQRSHAQIKKYLLPNLDRWPCCTVNISCTEDIYSCRKMPTYEHWRESHKMTLSEFAKYYGDGYPQAFIIEHIADREGHDLQEGQ